MRTLFASFPVWSLGLLSWVPMLRFALQRRRSLDWAVLGLYVLLTAGLLVWLDLLPTTETEEGEVAEVSALVGFFWLSLIVAATVHAVRGDRFERPGRAPAVTHTPVAYPAPYYAPPAPYGPPSPYGPPPAAAPGALAGPATAPPSSASPRMRQVADELDELGAYLRKEEEGGNR
ncbi:hypothetical protein ACFVUW_18490 [Streptomyces xiamenensis]|uniref:hypothetical protein n=1 Tax=Streptomyces xiamenensis TaxID=408015 RepID=UPI0036ED5758